MDKSKQELVAEIVRSVKAKLPNLVMPGNPRYQPKELVLYLGYDNLTKPLIDVELATQRVLEMLNVLCPEAAELLTDDLRKKLHKEITTTLQDAIEREITHHDIMALIEAIRVVLRKVLRDKAELLIWGLHIPATSYDKIDTGRIIAYKQAFQKVTLPSSIKLAVSLREKVVKFSGVKQIGRSHGQHGEPITVGFWLATILARLINIIEHMIVAESELRGKFSGAMGACNSQVALGLEQKAQLMFGKSFEELVLEQLGLKPDLISTQILLPEPLERFLNEYLLLSGVLGQLASDIRHLARSEIGEVAESFEKYQVASSAMSHKRNPIKSEGVVCLHTNIKSEFHKVIDTLTSDHNRDATNMCIMREFPGIVVLVQQQLDVMNKVILDLYIDEKALKRNFDMNRHLILSEIVHSALIMAGYRGDAHHFVNHVLVPRSAGSEDYLIDELLLMAAGDEKLAAVVKNIPAELVELLRRPEDVTGKAKEKAKEVAMRADDLIAKYGNVLK